MPELPPLLLVAGQLLELCVASSATVVIDNEDELALLPAIGTAAGVRRRVGRDQQLARVDVSRELGPHEQPPSRSGVVRVRREVLLDGAQHHVAPFAVEVLDPLDVLIDEPAFGHFIGGHLLGHARSTAAARTATASRGR